MRPLPGCSAITSSPVTPTASVCPPGSPGSPPSAPAWAAKWTRATRAIPDKETPVTNQPPSYPPPPSGGGYGYSPLPPAAGVICNPPAGGLWTPAATEFRDERDGHRLVGVSPSGPVVHDRVGAG